MYAFHFVSDSGIGMTRQELVDCLGTIAQSGTAKFLKALKVLILLISLISQFPKKIQGITESNCCNNFRTARMLVVTTI